MLDIFPLSSSAQNTHPSLIPLYCARLCLDLLADTQCFKPTFRCLILDLIKHVFQRRQMHKVYQIVTKLARLSDESLVNIVCLKYIFELKSRTRTERTELFIHSSYRYNNYVSGSQTVNMVSIQYWYQLPKYMILEHTIQCEEQCSLCTDNHCGQPDKRIKDRYSNWNLCRFSSPFESLRLG